MIHEVEDIDDVGAWRAAIRRQARADKIKVRTGINDGIVWALRVRSPYADALAAAVRYRNLLRRTARLAVELRHEPILAVRDGDELVCTCDRCSALGYSDAAENVVGGALFEDECPMSTFVLSGIRVSSGDFENRVMAHGRPTSRASDSRPRASRADDGKLHLLRIRG